MQRAGVKTALLLIPVNYPHIYSDIMIISVVRETPKTLTKWLATAI